MLTDEWCPVTVHLTALFPVSLTTGSLSTVSNDVRHYSTGYIEFIFFNYNNIPTDYT